jgi:hypothetical protein
MCSIPVRLGPRIGGGVPCCVLGVALVDLSESGRCMICSVVDGSCRIADAPAKEANEPRSFAGDEAIMNLLIVLLWRWIAAAKCDFSLLLAGGWF